MTENSVKRQKYMALMAQIEAQEQAVADLEKEIRPDAQDVQLLRQKLLDAQRSLAEKRTELARLSDGCGRPHPN